LAVEVARNFGVPVVVEDAGVEWMVEDTVSIEFAVKYVPK
jgi:hypothetical protein